MKAIIFDMDGTMIDNMMIHHRAWQRQLHQAGLDWTLEEVKEKIHGVNIEIIKKLFGDQFTEQERIDFSAAKEAEYRRIYTPQIKLIDGLQAFLDKIKTANIPMGIGTAAPGNNANWVLDTLDLRDYFQCIFHSGDVQNGKPHPEVFLKVADAMKIPIEDCVVFEDSVAGAETALNAGCKAVIVTTTHSKEEFAHFPHIIKFIDNYDEINLAEIGF